MEDYGKGKFLYHWTWALPGALPPTNQDVPPRSSLINESLVSARLDELKAEVAQLAADRRTNRRPTRRLRALLQRTNRRA